MAWRCILLGLLWLRQLDYSFVVAQVAISQRLCLWPQLETKTITCSSDGSSLIFIKSIVMTRLLGGLTTCTTAKTNDAPELIDCRVTLGTRDSYFADINRLCADKPSCNIHGNGNVAAYVGQSLCGFGMENSTIRNLVVLTLQCYAVQVTQAATTASTRITTTAGQTINSSPALTSRTALVQPTAPGSARVTEPPVDDAFSSTVSQTDNGTAKVIAGASVGGAIVLFGIVALLVWLRRRGVDRCCTALSGKKYGRFGGSGGLAPPPYDDVLLDEGSGDGGEGGGRAVEQLRRMIAEEQSKQARRSRKRRGSRAASSVSGRSAGRRHRHRSSRHVHAGSDTKDDDDDDSGGGTTRRRSHHRSAGKTGHSTATTSRHGGGHRHHHRSRHHQKKQRGTGRQRTRPSSKRLADGGEWRRSTEITDEQSSIPDVELLAYVEGPAVAGEEAAAGDEWVDETPYLGLTAVSESGLSSEGAPDGGSELAKPRSDRRPHHRRHRRGETKASRRGADGAGKTSRSSRRHSSDDDGGKASQTVDTVAASSREHRRHRRQSRSVVAGIDGRVAAAERATDAQEGDGSAPVALASSAHEATAGETETTARRGRSRRERESAGPSVRCDDGTGRGGDEAPTADGERRRSSGKSERATKTSRRAERGEGSSSRRHHHHPRDVNDGTAAAVRDRTNVDESRRRRQRRVQLPKTKSRSSQKRSLRRKEYELRRNDKFVSGSSESDSDVAAAAPSSRPSDGSQLAGSHPSAELLDMMKEQQEQRRRRLQQQHQQSEERGRRPKDKKSGSHGGGSSAARRGGGKSENKKRRSGSRNSAAAAGGGAERSCSSQLLAADAIAAVAKIEVRNDAELVAISGNADVQYATAAGASSGHSPGCDGGGGKAGLCQYHELSAVATRSDECTEEMLSSCEPIHQQEGSSSIVFTRNSTIAAYDFKYDPAAANEDGVYHCVVVDANQNMSDACLCSICQRREDSCECLNSVLVDAFSRSTVAPPSLCST